MMSTKEKEMNTVVERIARLRHIANELFTMFEINCATEITSDPTWHQTERPETIITVTDEETSVKPYVTPEEEETLEKNRAIAEKKLQDLLADDFREKTLNETMDGLLEVR